MRHFNELPSLRLQPSKRKILIPFDVNNKKKGAAIMLLSPNEETSYKMMNLPYIYNPQYFISYYMDRKVDNYINPDMEKDIQEFIDSKNEAMLHNVEEPDDIISFNPTRPIKFSYVGGTSLDIREISGVYNSENFNYWCDRFGVKKPDKNINVVIHSSVEDLEDFLREKGISNGNKYIIYSYTEDNNIHILSRFCYKKNVMDGPYECYVLNELISYIIQKRNPKFNPYVRNYVAIAASGQYVYFSTNKDFLEKNDENNIRYAKIFYDAISRRDWKRIQYCIVKNNIGCMRGYIKKDIETKMKDFIKPVQESLIMNENWIINRDDIYTNFKLWASKKKNILYITGLSGSGKSTLGKELAEKYGAEYIELDNLTLACSKYKSKSERGISNLSPTLLEYWNSVDKHFTFISWNDVSTITMEMNQFNTWMYKNHSNDGKLYVIEGCQIAMCLSPQDLIYYPLIIKGTSSLTSLLRRGKRSFHYQKEKETNNTTIEAILKGIRAIKMGLKNNNFLIDELQFQQFERVYNLYKDMNESSLNEACKNVDEARKFVHDVSKLAKKYNANYFIVTDGASGTSNGNGGVSNPAVKYARNNQIEWEKKNGFDPDEDWSDSFNEVGSFEKSDFGDVLKITNSLNKKDFGRICYSDAYKNSPFVIHREFYRDIEPIGYLEVYHFPSTPKCAQLTAAVKESYRGKGIMPSLVMKLLNSDVAETHGIEYYIWNVAPDNYSSIRVAEKCGFIDTGKRNSHGCKTYVYPVKGTKNDFVRYMNKKMNEKVNLSKDPIIQNESYIGTLNESSNIELYFNTEELLNDKILNEAPVADQKRMKKFLYQNRIKTNNQALEAMKRAREANPNIKKIFLKLEQYKGLNLYIDMSYYHDIFLRNNTVKLDRGVELYFNFLNKMINNKEYKEYKKKTIFIPLFKDIWGPYTPDIFDYRKRLNPLSMIFRLMKRDPEKLKAEWGNKTIVFLGDNGYFKVDFSDLTYNKLNKFRKNCDKLLSDTVITDKDVEESSDELINDDADSKIAITTNIIDRIEKSTNIRIDNIVSGIPNDSVDLGDHLRIRQIEYRLEDNKKSLICILSPDKKSLEDTMKDNIIKNSNKIDHLVIKK